MSKSNVVRMGLMGSAAALALAVSAPSAWAYETQFGDVNIILDTTVSMGASMRTADRIDQFLPETNGGPIDPRANPALGATGVHNGTLVAPLSGFTLGTNVYNNPYSNFDGTINADDARLNFDKGDLIGANVKASHDFQLTWHNYKIFARGVGFYDVVMNDKDVGERSEITDAALGDVGRNYELLDAFISADYTVAEMPVNLRVGKQVINWGESTFILGGNNVFNPIDVGAFRRPGSEIKEALVPVNAIYGSISLPFDVALSGYYALDWEPFELDPSGTPFAGSDLVTLGGGVGGNQRYSFVTSSPTSGPRRNCTAAAGSGTNFVQSFDTDGNPLNGVQSLLNDPSAPVGGAAVNNNLLECTDNLYINYQTPFPVGQQERIRINNALTMGGDGVTVGTSGLLDRGNDVFASDDGQYGISLKWYAESLGGTEFGFYYQNYHSRLPIASVGVVPNAQAQFQFFVNGDNTAFNSSGIGGRQLAPAGCGLGNPLLIGQIANPGIVVLDSDPVTPGNQTVFGAGLTMGGFLNATLGSAAVPGTAAYQMVNTPVVDPGNVLPTAAAALAILSGGTFTMDPTNGFKNQLAVTQLNCALAYYQSGLVDPDGAGPAAITIQSFDGAEFGLGAGGGALFFTYPEDIEEIGWSFNTTAWGWGIQGDFTYRQNAPFQVDGDSLTIAALVNGCVFSQLYGGLGNIVIAPLATKDGAGNTPFCGSQRTLANGELRNQMYTAQVGTTATFTASDWEANIFGADLGILVTEVGMVLVPGVEDTWLNKSPSYRGAQYGNTGCQGTDLPGAGILGLDIKTSKQCRPNDLSAGLVALYRLDYNNAFDTGFLISPQIAYSWDFEGTTPAPYGNYAEDRQSVNLSVTGTLNNNFRVGASYTNFFGGHVNNKSRDLDFASVTASYTF